MLGLLGCCLALPAQADLFDVLEEDNGDEAPETGGARGWYGAAGAGVHSFEGWGGGSFGVLTLGRMFDYSPAASPRSSVALELELSHSIDSISRRRDGRRREIDVTSVGGWLALNTFMTERTFHRVRLGGIYRYLPRDPGGNQHQARVGFGLGLGMALTERVEVVADTTVHYLGTQDLLYGVAGNLRFHF